MNEGDRKTRYNCTSFPPPGLEKIYKQIRRSLTKGLLKTQADIRAAAGAADREYSDRGPQDELQRFLRNMGVLVEDTIQGGFYFDEKRAQVVAAACEAGSLPGPAPDPFERLIQLKVEAHHRIEGALSDFDEEHGSNGSAGKAAFESNKDEIKAIPTPPPADNPAARESFLPEDVEDWSWILNSDLRPYSAEEIGAATDPELEEYRSRLDRVAHLVESSRSLVNTEVKHRIERRLSYIQAERAQYEREIADLLKQEQALLARMPVERSA